MLDEIAREVYNLTEKAGLAIADYVASQNDLKINKKADLSPVTEADLLANKIIIEGLESFKTMGEYPILTEEGEVVPYEERCHWKRYWCVDPLDGTRDFIAGSRDYTVNVALIEDYHPVVGAVYAPAKKLGYFAAKGFQAYKVDSEHNISAIHTRKMDLTDFKVAMSRHHASQKLLEHMKSFPGAKIEQLGSSLKICSIAEGSVDCYPRLSPTSEWDLAAAQVILEVAGGAILNMEFNPLMYNNKSSIIQPPFLAVGEPTFDWAPFVRLMQN